MTNGADVYSQNKPSHHESSYLVIEKNLFSSIEFSDFIWHLLEHELCRRISNSVKKADIGWAFTSHSHICIQLNDCTKLFEASDNIWNSNSWSTLEYQETGNGPRGRIVEECHRYERNIFKTLENSISSNSEYWTIPSEAIANTTSLLLVNPVDLREHNHVVDETPRVLKDCNVLVTYYHIAETMALVEVRLTQIDDVIALPLFLIFSDYSKLFKGFRETLDEWVDLYESSYLISTKRLDDTISIRIYLNGDVDTGFSRLLSMIQKDTATDLIETTNIVNHNLVNVGCKHRLSVTCTSRTFFADHQSVTGLLNSIRSSAYNFRYSDISNKFNHFPRLTMDEIRILERYSSLDEMILEILINNPIIDKNNSHRNIHKYVENTIESVKKRYIYLYQNTSFQHRILVIYENRMSNINRLKEAIYNTSAWYGRNSKDINGGFIHIASCFTNQPDPKYPGALYVGIHSI